MITARADVPTEHASRYLQQLCKHWSHRFEVAFDPNRGTVRMTGATLALAAEPDRLLMTLDIADPANHPRLCDVVTDHLKRFAFKKEGMEVRWSTDDGGA